MYDEKPIIICNCVVVLHKNIKTKMCQQFVVFMISPSYLLPIFSNLGLKILIAINIASSVRMVLEP